MAVQILSRRSSVLHDRPFPTRLGTAELAINNNAGQPGLFFADNTAHIATKDRRNIIMIEKGFYKFK